MKGLPNSALAVRRGKPHAGAVKWCVRLPFVVLCTCSTAAPRTCPDPPRDRVVDCVDPFIGTGGSGSTFPGAVVPWGMVSVSPDTGTSEGAGYRHDDPFVLGFGHNHVSGSIPELGHFLVMPTTGPIETAPERWRSQRGFEHAAPGDYRVLLTRYEVLAEVTATPRVGLSRFTFPRGGGPANILLDAAHSLSYRGNVTVEASVTVRSETEIEGWCRSASFTGAGAPPTAYFFARLNRPSSARGTWSGEALEEAASQHTVSPGTWQHAASIGAWLRYDIAPTEPLLMKLGLSYVSVENARRNLEAELPGWDFEGTRSRARRLWSEALSRIEVSGGSGTDRVKFYTALYHALLHPNLLSDVTGEYPGMNGTGTRRSTRPRYTVFSLWDTYRTVHPLLTLVYPDRQIEMLRSIVGMAQESGWLPLWELAGEEINSMVGDPAVPVIVDTYLKGLEEFDVYAAYRAMLRSATEAPPSPPGPRRPKGRPGLREYLRLGYIPEDEPALKAPPDAFEQLGVWGSVSTTLDYAYDDWCIARLADRLGRVEDHRRFLVRASSYRNLFDRRAIAAGSPSIAGFFRPRDKDGGWHTPFEVRDYIPGRSKQSPGYVEGGPWQSAFQAPHDVNGLKELHGGDAAFAAKLDAFFSSQNDPYFNEPTIGWPYLYNFVEDRTASTQRLVRLALSKRFGVTPEGIPGNDDAGTLSAWFIFSAMGFYPFCPGDPSYQLGSPLFDEIVIRLAPPFYPGRDFRVKAVDNGPGHPYVAAVRLDGRQHASTRLEHAAIVRGGSLVFYMSGRAGREEPLQKRSLN